MGVIQLTFFACRIGVSCINRAADFSRRKRADISVSSGFLLRNILQFSFGIAKMPQNASGGALIGLSERAGRQTVGQSKLVEAL